MSATDTTQKPIATKNEWFADVRTNRRIDIPEIDGWIEVREEISIGEERAVFAGAVKGQTTTKDGPRTEYDAEKVSFGLVLAYITDWSARDKDDKPVKFGPDALKALKPHVYHAIEDAVQKHVQEVEAKKKQQTSSSSGDQTSRSHAG